MWKVNPHKANRWVARGMPLVVLGLLGFSAWVFAAQICDDYLIKRRRRRGTAAVLLTIFAILLALTAICYIRTSFTITADPGKVPCASAKASDTEKAPSILPETQDLNEKSRPIAAGKSRKHGGKDKRQRPHRYEADNLEEIPLETGEHLRAVSYTSTSAPPSRQRNVSTPPPVHLAPGTPTTPRPTSDDGSQSVQTVPQSPGTLYGTQEDHRELLSVPDVDYVQTAPSTYSISRPHSMAAWLLPKNLNEFYTLDAFICEADGLPRWCAHCLCWKPDRSHHCGELGRCIRKMDHFCPWVGGVVGETSFKFFFQTVFYGFLYCMFVLIATAIYLDDRGKIYGDVPPTWIALLVLLFCAGMTSTTLDFILRNTSTIDNMSASTKVYHIAIHDPNDINNSEQSPSNANIKRVTFPDADPAHVGVGEYPKRTFVIAETQPGENPWRLDSRLENFKEVMGKSVWDWFLPIRESPCALRVSEASDIENNTPAFRSMYKFNPKLIDRLRENCGISTSGIPTATASV